MDCKDLGVGVCKSTKTYCVAICSGSDADTYICGVSNNFSITG